MFAFKLTGNDFLDAKSFNDSANCRAFSSPSDNNDKSPKDLRGALANECLGMFLIE